MYFGLRSFNNLKASLPFKQRFPPIGANKISASFNTEIRLSLINSPKYPKWHNLSPSTS